MAFNRDNLGLGFDITGDSRDAIRALDAVEDKAKQTTASVQRLSIEQRNSAAFARKVVEDAQRIKSSPFARNLAAESREVEKRLDSIFGVSTRAAKGLDTFSDSARRGRSSIGQFIEAIAQGDPGELLGEIAQNGGKAGIAFAAVTLAVAGTVVAIGALTKTLIENVKEVDKLSKDYKLATSQVQALQTYANLTGESVEDLAENYKKLGPEVKRIEELIKSSGAAIDNDLRKKVQQTALAWEEVKIVATGALNDLGKELLPVVTVALQDIRDTIQSINWKSLGADAAEFFIDVIVYAKEAKYEVSKLASGLSKIFIPDPDVKTAGEAVDKILSGASDIGDALKGDVSGIRKEIEDRIRKLRDEASKGVSRGSPNLTGKDDAAKARLDELERQLKAEEQIYRDSTARLKREFDERKSTEDQFVTESELAVKRRLAATLTILSQERATLAGSNLKDEEKNKGIADIDARVAEVERESKRELEEIALNHNKRMLQFQAEFAANEISLTRTKNQRLEAIYRDAAEKQLLSAEEVAQKIGAFRKAEIESEIALQQERIRKAGVNQEQRTLEIQKLTELEERKKAIIEDSARRTDEARQRDLQSQRDYINTLKSIAAEAAAIQQQAREINTSIFAASILGQLRPRATINKQADTRIAGEDLRHQNTIEDLNRRAQETADDERVPLQKRLDIFKEMNALYEAEAARHAAVVEQIENERINSLNALSPLQERFNELGIKFFGEQSQAAVSFSQIIGQAFDSFAQGLGATVEQFVLLGTTGPAALKKLTAQVLAQVAAQAAVKAIFELAEGFAMLFVNPVAAGAHFKAAALYGTVAAVAGVAGRAVAGDSFKGGGGAGGSGGSVGGAQQGLRLNREVFFGDRANNPVVVHLRGEYQPGIIVREVTQDYRRNGSTRQTYRNDISGEGFSVV